MEIKGIKYIGPIFDNCYDSTTELLTGTGWKHFKDVTYEDTICTLNEQQVIEYHKPTDIICKDYIGPMYNFKSAYSKIDLLVTPNHNMYTQSEKGRLKDKVQEDYVSKYGVKKLNNYWSFEKAESIVNKKRYFKKDANYIKEDLPTIEVAGRTIPTDKWLEFLGYYLSEGSSTIHKSHYIVQIRQFGSELHKMARALGSVTNNKINIKSEDGRVIVNDKELCTYLKSTFGNVYTKHIPRYILDNCSKRQLTILFEALMLGDGHDLRENYKEGLVSGGSSYHTASLTLKDTFMELLLKIGYSGSTKIKIFKGAKIFIYDRECVAGADNWSILIKFSNNVCVKSDKTNFYADKIDYKGTIHCVTVKNHTLYIRRNGCCVWSGNSGYAKANRGNIMALHSLDVPVTLAPISFENSSPGNDKESQLLSSLVNKDIDYNIVIMHCTPEFYAQLREEGKTNIAYTIWETTKLHPDWAPYINASADKVLVGSEWNVDIFKEAGVTIPIGCVPHGIDMSVFDDIKSYPIQGVSDDTFMFYSIFEWQERKNPSALLKAYWHAFRDGEDVALVIKTSGDRSKLAEAIKHLKSLSVYKNYPKVFLISDKLSEDEMHGLHARGDCYASLDRGEGFGLCPFTAGACGNPIIVTGFGGTTEYAKEDNSYLVDYQLTPVFGMPWSPWYLSDQLWAEPDIVSGANKMRQAYEDRVDARGRGDAIQDDIYTNFSWEVIGNKIIKELEQV